MKIVALDLATCTGFARSVDGRLMSYLDAQVFGDGKDKACGGLRWPKARFNIEWLLSDADVAYYESPMGIMKNKAATTILIGLENCLNEVAARRGIRCVGVPQPTIKKFATGKGNAKKPAMIGAAYRLWPSLSSPRVKDIGSDEADALCLLAYAIQAEKEIAA